MYKKKNAYSGVIFCEEIFQNSKTFLFRGPSIPATFLLTPNQVSFFPLMDRAIYLYITNKSSPFFLIVTYPFKIV